MSIYQTNIFQVNELIRKDDIQQQLRQIQVLFEWNTQQFIQKKTLIEILFHQNIHTKWQYK